MAAIEGNLLILQHSLMNDHEKDKPEILRFFAGINACMF
jgi:hypothetical protein